MLEDIRNLCKNLMEDEENPIQLAIDELGLTDDMREAGFILADGRMLDFSGKIYDRRNAGKHLMDHSDISVTGYDKYEFRDLGNVRVFAHSNGGNIDISTPPTREQVTQLKRFIDFCRGEVSIDMSDKGHNLESKNYEHERSNVIIREILGYFGSRNESTTLDHYLQKLKKEKRQKKLRKEKIDRINKEREETNPENIADVVNNALIPKRDRKKKKDIQPPSKGSAYNFKFLNAKVLSHQDQFNMEPSGNQYIYRF